MSTPHGIGHDDRRDAGEILGLVDRDAMGGPGDLVLPPGSRLDPTYLFEVSTITNRAHAALGTELVDVGAHRGAIRLRCRPELVEADGTWAPGVVASLADHVCSFTSVVSLGDLAHFGGTMSLRVEFATAASGDWLVARARAVPGPDAVLRIAATIHAVGGAGDARVVRRVASVRCGVLDRRLAP